MGEFYNLDSLVDKPKIVTLAGREINVAKVPAIVVFKADELREKLRDFKIENSRELIEAAVDIILMIAKASGDPVEKDWLLENATVEQILEFVAVATLGPDYKKTGKKKEPAKDSDEST